MAWVWTRSYPITVFWIGHEWDHIQLECFGLGDIWVISNYSIMAWVWIGSYPTRVSWPVSFVNFWFLWQVSEINLAVPTNYVCFFLFTIDWCFGHYDNDMIEVFRLGLDEGCSFNFNCFIRYLFTFADTISTITFGSLKSWERPLLLTNWMP